MKSDKAHPESMDDYVALHPKAVQEMLQKLRATIRKAAPGAEEVIKYGMPTFVLKGNLVFFSAYKNHIGFYPRVQAFKKELSAYEGGKGTIQFPLGKPLPLALIGKMVKFRVQQNLERAKVKVGRKKK
ncbi:MAG TPA: DUF1801 domain-containing protein [Cyclobacteriaceae bacterium]|nr:DUF1801 domain-containing protein [Cyclobacteriaceae bacterium]